MDVYITISVLNSLDYFFAQFLGITSHETWEKRELFTPKSLSKSWEKKKL